MSESKVYKEFMQCPICGDTLLKKNNLIVCDCCGFSALLHEISSFDEARLNSASDALRSYRFDLSEELYSVILGDATTISLKAACIFGKLLASFGVVYIKDINNTLIPTFADYNPEIKSIQNSIYYHELEKLSKYDSSVNSYLDKAKKLDEIYQRIDNELNEDEVYDVFICTKISQKTIKDPNKVGYTLDSKIADEFYYSLKESGLKVFYSDKDCNEIKYDSQILSALLKSKKIMVIATELDYLTSSWVESEWRRWLNLIEVKKKAEDSLVLYFPHFDKEPFELPRALRRVQRYTTTLQVMNALKINEKKAEPKQKGKILSQNIPIENQYKKVLKDIIEKHNVAIKKLQNTKNGYIYFGMYPQTKKKKGVVVTENRDETGRYYKGVDGNIYFKGLDEYFKVEPIKWKVLYNYENKMLLISDKILTNFYMADQSSILQTSWHFKDNYFNGYERRLIKGEATLLSKIQCSESLGYFDRIKKQTDYAKTDDICYGWALRDYTYAGRSNSTRSIVSCKGKITDVDLLSGKNNYYRKAIGYVPVIELEVSSLEYKEFDPSRLFTLKHSGWNDEVISINVKAGDIVRFSDTVLKTMHKTENSQYFDNLAASQSGLVLDVHVNLNDQLSNNKDIITIYVDDVFNGKGK